MGMMGGLGGARIVGGAALAAVGLTLATTALVAVRGTIALASVTLVYLACVVAVAAVGGVWPAIFAALASDVLLNYFFVLPFHAFTVDSPDNAITLLVYVTVAVTVAVAVDLAARQRAAAARHGVESRELAEIDRLRSALLAAVGHDLRTPLAGSKAAVSSLRDPDLAITGEQADELLGTIEESTDRMSALVENLLAMSRLQAGALSVSARPVALDEMVAAALLHESDVDVDVPEDLPLAWADPGLIERVIVNLVDNACRAGPPVRVTAEAVGGRLLLRISDSGPGVPDADKERVFAPFQRLGDRTADGGLGLGLAIARGFTEAMGGTLEPGDTPGGGLTMTVTLPPAAS
ncbi:ATP-binding protein [Phytomonospora sp. NPDC050363]|uniref:sensor histidine kinase n=1 Tax=Phytomonospora sp. NPDC050363 TaxID=3155642 RepID=UPI00340CDE0A